MVKLLPLLLVLLVVESFSRRQRPFSPSGEAHALLELSSRSSTKFSPSMPQTLSSRALRQSVKRQKVLRAAPDTDQFRIMPEIHPRPMYGHSSEGDSSKQPTSLGLSRAEEKACASAAQNAFSWQQTYDELEKALQRKPRQEEWAVACGFNDTSAFKSELQESLRAKTKMLSANLGLVYTIAKHYRGLSRDGYTFEDMVHEGALALDHALSKFDPDKGKFSTYAFPWIKTFILQANDKSDLVKVSGYRKRQLRRIGKIESELAMDLGREPSHQEIAEKSGLSEDKLYRLEPLGKKPLSLDSTMVVHTFPLSETLADGAEGVIESNRKEELDWMKQQIERVLMPRERAVVMMREGMQSNSQGKRMSFVKISQVLGISRNRASQIYRRALEKLREVYKQYNT